MLSAIEPLLTDSDRYKQRAGAEILCGILRGTFTSPVFAVLHQCYVSRLQALAAATLQGTLDVGYITYRGYLSPNQARYSNVLGGSHSCKSARKEPRLKNLLVGAGTIHPERSSSG